MKQLLSQRGFLRLAAAYSLNELAWWVGTLSLSLLVYRRTGSVLGSAGFFLCAQAAPAIVSPLLVGRVDRLSPRRSLPALYAVEVILYAVLAWLTGHFALVPVLALVVVDGTVALAARSIAAAARTEILKPADLVREGSAAVATAFSICYLVGPAISGFIVAAGGTRAALLTSCGLFGLMSLSLLGSAIPSRIVHFGPGRGRLRAAVAEVRRVPALVMLFSTQAVTAVLFTIPLPIEVVLADRTLHAGASGYGVLLSAWGGGAVVGSLGYARWRRLPRRILLSVGCTFMGLGFGIMAVAPTLAVALVGAAGAGIATGMVSSSISSELQSITEQSWVALVQSISTSIGTLAPGLGIILGATIAQLASVRIAFGAAAVGILVTAVAIAVLFTPERMRTEPPPPERAVEPPEPPEPAHERHAGTLV
jgi:predicted MFS family arabinose efflux permease